MHGAEELYRERLARYQGAIRLQPIDRVPIACGSNYFAEIYAGHDKQQFVYDATQWAVADEVFVRDFPAVDAHRSGRFWGPLHDAVGFSFYKLPGRDLAPDVQYQFVEAERMRADEYELLIHDRAAFLFERFLPRALGEFGASRARSYMAFLKGGIAWMQAAAHTKARVEHLERQLGMPLAMQGAMLAPFDYLADGLRGLEGIMLDLRRQPDRVKEACDALIPEAVSYALALADPLRRYPIFIPFHRGCRPFLSPAQFDEFYWPSLQQAMLLLIEAGYTIRAYLEGDWSRNWHHMRELPAGTVLCDIDVQGDIFRAKEEIGDWQCLAGGVPDSLLILGAPKKVRERVKLLCERVGEGGGFIVNGGCQIPYDTRPENFRALTEAVLEYGGYGQPLSLAPMPAAEPPASWSPPRTPLITTWATKRKELGDIPGDEALIAEGWESLERAAHTWLWSWIW